MWFRSYTATASLFSAPRFARSVSSVNMLLHRNFSNVLKQQQHQMALRPAIKATLQSRIRAELSIFKQQQMTSKKAFMSIRFLSTSKKPAPVATPNINKSKPLITNNSSKRWYYQNFSRFKLLESNMLKAFGFTIIFSTACFFGIPYLFEYTPMKYFKTNPQALVYAIAAVNAVVFLLWKAPKYLPFMDKYFVLKNPISGSFNYWQIIGSSFSHQELWHFAFNMLALLSFGTTLVQFLNPSNFLTLYLTSASVSSLFSITLPYLLRQGLSYFGSLGASGALFGVMGCFSWIFPKAGISLFFFPIPGGAWVAFLLSIGVNAAGLILKWGRFDYAGHLGGSLAGLFGGWYYMESYRKQREERLRRFF